jgi:hypothetical protein
MNQEMRKSLNLFQLSKEKMLQVEVGGVDNGCYCACAWYGTPGGSSPLSNDKANNDGNWNSPCES